MTKCKHKGCVVKYAKYNYPNEINGLFCKIHQKDDMIDVKTQEFIRKAKLIHGEKYDYNKVDYNHNKIHITIKCNICNNEFNQIPSDHLQGCGCSQCANIKYRLTTQEFIRRAKLIHDDTYDYSKVDYKNTRLSISIKCNVCNMEFKQSPNSHLQGKGCFQCANIKHANKHRLTTQEFIRRAKLIHDDIYDYSKVDYKHNKIHISIKCNVCNMEFKQTPFNHLQGYGCSNCKHKTELKLYNFLELYYPTKRQIKFDWCINEKTNKKLPFDFIIEQFKIIIELDGLQHFQQVSNWQNPLFTQERDKFKMKKALEKGYFIIRILQDDVRFDKNDWKNKLNSAIKYYQIPSIIFLSDSDLYNCYKEN
jgi:hypothetical protein